MIRTEQPTLVTVLPSAINGNFMLPFMLTNSFGIILGSFLSLESISVMSDVLSSAFKVYPAPGHSLPASQPTWFTSDRLSQAHCNGFRLLSQTSRVAFVLHSKQQLEWCGHSVRQIMSTCCLKPSSDFPSLMVMVSIPMTAKGPVLRMGPCPFGSDPVSPALFLSLSLSTPDPLNWNTPVHSSESVLTFPFDCHPHFPVAHLPPPFLVVCAFLEKGLPSWYGKLQNPPSIPFHSLSLLSFSSKHSSSSNLLYILFYWVIEQLMLSECSSIRGGNFCIPSVCHRSLEREQQG